MAWAEPPRRGEEGFSLVESVIAVVIMGIIVSAMIGGMATSIAMSSLHREQSISNAVMVSAAETVKTAAYVPCAAGGDASPPGNPSAGDYSTTAVLPTGPPLLQAGVAPWPASAIITTVQYWNPLTYAWESSCHDTPPRGDGLGGPFPMQLVTILVAHPGSGIKTPCPQYPAANATTCVSIVKRAL